MHEKVRVLFLDSRSTLLSDSEVHRLLMKSYDPDRVEVHVACNRGVRKENSASFRAFEAIPGLHVLPVHFGEQLTGASRAQLARSALPVLYGYVQLAYYARRNQIDVIHVASRPRDMLYGITLARLIRARIVIHVHLKVSDWFSSSMRLALRACDSILCISDFVARSARAAGYPSEKIDVVLNGLEAEEWDPRTDGTPVRSEFGIPFDAPVLAVVSRLFHWKGHTELLQALAAVRQVEPRVKLLIVGEDDERAQGNGGSYRQELEGLVLELGLTESVIFTGFRSDIQRILSACDIYTMPSFEEPLGVAFLEAMAMKKPVVALASGGVPEVVEDGKAGLLSTPGDIQALASNILTLIRDAQLRCRMGAHGRLRVEQYHDPRQVARETEQIYRRIIA